MNILHTVNENEITPEHFLACIEIPAGSSCKYEMDEHSGALKLEMYWLSPLARLFL